MANLKQQLKLARMTRALMATDADEQSAPALYHVCCKCSALNAVLKCACLATYYCSSACQRAHYLKHKRDCTTYLCKGIKKKGAVKSQLEVQGSSDGVEYVYKPVWIVK